MKKKEINEKFKKLDEQIQSLEKAQEDHYDSIQFLISVIKKHSDEPIFRTRLSDNWYKGFFEKEHLLQYIYNNKIKEIQTYSDIQAVELFAYCDTHFILKNHNNRYFLVDMAKGVITDIPVQLLFSKEMKLNIEGQTLKICHTGPGVIGIRRNTDD